MSNSLETCRLCNEVVMNYEEQARVWRGGLVHDSCIVERILPVLEAAGAFVQFVHEGESCPFCQTPDEHDEDCRLKPLVDALDWATK